MFLFRINLLKKFTTKSYFKIRQIINNLIEIDYLCINYFKYKNPLNFFIINKKF